MDSKALGIIILAGVALSALASKTAYAYSDKYSDTIGDDYPEYESEDFYDYTPAVPVESFPGTAADSDGFTYSDVDVEGDFAMPATNWKINEYPKYASALRDTEIRNGIPTDLLARQLAKETGNFQASIISGVKRSPVGAMGIGQFMPATGIQYGLMAGSGPGTRSDPFASIAAAGRYMRDLYAMFNDWRYALAAYNWGPGNVQKWMRGDLKSDGTRFLPPAETRDYLASITADVPLA